MRVLVFQHTGGEHPAAFSKHMEAAGDTAHIVRWHRGETPPNLDGFDMLLVMGGPMDVWETEANPWLIEEKDAINKWVREIARPYLGVCLGHQLLSEALGGACQKMTVPEIAVAMVNQTEMAQSDPIFSALPHRFPTLQWHGVEISVLPENSAILARNEACSIQAFRVGDKAWGVQFHPEVESTTLRDWMNDTANRDCAIDWLGSAEAADQFIRDCEQDVPAFLERSATIYNAWRQTA